MLNWSRRGAPLLVIRLRPAADNERHTSPAAERQVLKRRLRASYAPNASGKLGRFCAIQGW